MYQKDKPKGYPGGKAMTRYCPKCKLSINFKDNAIDCPICTRQTLLETDRTKVERVRQLMIKANKS